MTADTTHRIRRILVKHLGAPYEGIDSESMLFKVAHVDSLERLELLSAIEEEFSIQIPNNTALQIDTLAKAVEAVEARLL